MHENVCVIKIHIYSNKIHINIEINKSFIYKTDAKMNSISRDENTSV